MRGQARLLKLKRRYADADQAASSTVLHGHGYWSLRPVHGHLRVRGLRGPAVLRRRPGIRGRPSCLGIETSLGVRADHARSPGVNPGCKRGAACQ